jgi:serine/threonine-protein kinase
MIGQTISHYKILEKLGEGGMGVVYKAQDTKLDRFVALKFLPPHLSASEADKARFMQEAKAASALNHPNVCTIYAIEEHEHQLFIAMEFVDGQTLRDLVRSNHDSTLPIKRAIDIGIQIADGLGAAHEKGIVHRDIKPENILLHEGRPLVADFGIARAAIGPDTSRMTQAGMALGTPAYMSPEQTAGDPDLDGRSDEYSLACMLYEMLAGAPPFAGGSAGALLVQRFTQAPPHISESQPTIGAALDHALHRAMAREPAERFASIAAFAEALRTPGTYDPAGEEKSIAVLPFENMSADRENDYFADGMSEEIINALTQLPGLRVVARTSAFSFKGKAIDLRAIGEKLQVKHVLEGSVRKAGSRLRITAQLVSVADGYHLWSERYDREMDDVFAIQDEIATTIAAKLQVTLAGSETGQLVKPATANLEAYDEYLKGMALMHRRGLAIGAAIESFRQAIALDPEYAPALAGLAHALTLSCFWGMTSPAEVGKTALDAASRALAANPDLAEVQVAAAMVAIGVEFDRAKAARAWDRAVQLGPTEVDVRTGRAVFHLCYVRGDFDAAVREVGIALRSDALNPTLHSQMGLVLAFAGRGAEAVTEAHRAIALEPSALFGHWILLHAFRVAGAPDQVIATGLGILRTFGRNVWIMMGLAGAYTAVGRLEEATALFDELVARSRTEYVQPAVLAIIAMHLGRRDEAVRRWARAAEDRDMLMVAMLLHAPLSATLRAQPEHAEVLRRLGWDKPLPPAD